MLADYRSRRRAVTPSATSRDLEVYVGRIATAPQERHLTTVPYLVGLDALCGQSVQATSQPREWRQALNASTCGACSRALLTIVGTSPRLGQR